MPGRIVCRICSLHYLSHVVLEVDTGIIDGIGAKEKNNAAMLRWLNWAGMVGGHVADEFEGLVNDDVANFCVLSEDSSQHNCEYDYQYDHSTQ